MSDRTEEAYEALRQRLKDVKMANECMRGELAKSNTLLDCAHIRIRQLSSERAVCANCRYYVATELTAAGDPLGHCTRYPPPPRSLPCEDGDSYVIEDVALLPESGHGVIVSEEMWCGEWQRGRNYGEPKKLKASGGEED